MNVIDDEPLGATSDNVVLIVYVCKFVSGGVPEILNAHL